MSKKRNPPEFAIRERQRILFALLMVFIMTGARAEEEDPIEAYMLEHMFDSAGQYEGPGPIESIVQIKTSIIAWALRLLSPGTNFGVPTRTGVPLLKRLQKA